MGLQTIASRLILSLGFERSDADDAVSEATLYAIGKIGKFRTGQGDSAFCYFTTVIINALRTYRRKLERNRFVSLDEKLAR